MTTTPADLITRSQKLSPVTKELYLHAVERFVAFAGSDPARWSPLVVEAYRDYLIADGMKPQSANTYLHGIRYAGRRWEALGLGSNFSRAAEYARIEGAARQKSKRQGLVRAELEKLLEATSGTRPPDLRDRAIVVLCIRAGGRRAVELASLHWEHIEGGVATFRIKGGYSLPVPLDGEAVASLEPWRQHLHRVGEPISEGPVFRALREQLDGRWVVGKRLSRQSLWSIIVKRGEAAGLRRHLHPHLLRWTYIGMAEAAGLSPQDIMRMTGHRSLPTLSGYISPERFEERSQNRIPDFTGPRRT